MLAPPSVEPTCGSTFAMQNPAPGSQVLGGSAFTVEWVMRRAAPTKVMMAEQMKRPRSWRGRFLVRVIFAAFLILLLEDCFLRTTLNFAVLSEPRVKGRSCLLALNTFTPHFELYTW